MILAAGSVVRPDLQLLRGDPRVLLRHHPEPRGLHHPAHGPRDAGDVPADGQAGQVDDGMQRAQPEIKKLQAKYKNDRAKLNEEMMKFYQENKINPLAGCLPLLVQMPIFFALFHVMRDPYKHIPKASDLYAAFCTGPARQAPHGRLQPPEAGPARTRRSSSGWTSRRTPPASPAGSSTRSPTSSSSAS